MIYNERFMTEYALKVVRGVCTQSDAQTAFKENYSTFLQLYNEVHNMDMLVKASKQMADLGTKFSVYGRIKQTVENITNFIEQMKSSNAVFMAERGTDYVQQRYKERYKDWTIEYSIDSQVLFETRPTGGYHSYYDWFTGEDIEVPDTEDVMIGYRHELALAYWKDIQAKTTILGDWTDAERLGHYPENWLENFIGDMLNDIGYTDDLRRREENIKRNKGLQVFLLMIQW